MLRMSKGPTKQPKKLTPNLLPCRISQDSPVSASSRYWAPDIASDGSREAYFRGRKLKGKAVKIPDGYQGVVMKDGGKMDDRMQWLQKGEIPDLEEGDGEDAEGTKVLEEIGTFDEIVLWGHEALVDADDAFAKGLDEWIGFAETVCVHAPKGGNHSPLRVPALI